MLCLKSWDFFGVEAKWRIHRQDRFKTKFSGFFSLLLYIYLIIKLVILLLRFFSREDYNVSFSETKLIEGEQINLSDFEVAFCLTDKNNEDNFVNILDYLT